MEEKNVQGSAPLSLDLLAVEREYRQKVTLTTARPRIVRAFFLAWFSVLFLGAAFFLVTIGWYGAQGMFTDAAYLSTIVPSNPSLHTRVAALAPHALDVGSAQSVPSGGDGMYDAFAVVKNTNTRHVAKFSYAFTSASGTSEYREAFLHPGESAPLFAPRMSEGRPSGLSVRIQDLSWQYLSPHRIPDIAEWYAERSAISIEQVAFANDIAYASGSVSRSTFTVHNRTAFSFWEPVFVVQLLRGGMVIGMTEMTLAQFLHNETRVVDLRWFGALPQTATVVVTPRIPFFDERAYMDPSASTTIDARDLWTTRE